MKRNDRPEKRRSPNAPTQSKEAQPIPKRMKNNVKKAIPQRTRQQIEENFRIEATESLIKLQLLPHSIILFAHAYQTRLILFKAISKYLFPLITQKRHKYFQSLKSIDFELCFNRYDEKERNLINECFTQFSLLPNLRRFYFHFIFGMDHIIQEAHGLASHFPR